MTVKNDRFLDILFAFVSEAIFSKLREIDHDFWVVSIGKIYTSKDRREVYIPLTCDGNIKELIAFLDPIKSKLRSKVSKDLGLYKAPNIRFVKTKEEVEETDILSLIESLSEKHELTP